jgi:hypothetical protein
MARAEKIEYTEKLAEEAAGRNDLNTLYKIKNGI